MSKGTKMRIIIDSMRCIMCGRDNIPVTSYDVYIEELGCSVSQYYCDDCYDSHIRHTMYTIILIICCILGMVWCRAGPGVD